MTAALAGTFPPTDELRQLADQANQRAARLFRRAKSAGAVRADLHLHDLAMLFEQLAAVRVGSPERTRTLRERYLGLLLDGLRPEAATTNSPAHRPALPSSASAGSLTDQLSGGSRR